MRKEGDISFMHGAVFAVSKEGHTAGCELHADLMGPSRVKPHGEETESLPRRQKAIGEDRLLHAAAHFLHGKGLVFHGIVV